MSVLDSMVENQIKEEALRYLTNGRTGWDVRHTLSAVEWMKRLIAAEGGDEKVLIPAIYFHDTGYEQLQLGYTQTECSEAKPGHAENSQRIAKEFLPRLNYFSEEELTEIYRLILLHDIHGDIEASDHNRQLIFEADGLAQIDWYNCKPSFDKENTIIFLNEYFNEERIPNFKTKLGTEKMNELLAQTEKYLKDWS